MKLLGKSDIKIFVNKFIQDNKSRLTNKIIIDLPAGAGVSSQQLHNIGANVHPYDLIPDFFQVDGLNCQPADMSRELNIDSNFADYLLCQEGIEHVADQLLLLKEFGRILKPGGRLLLTTPNYSNLAAKFSYLWLESELYKHMPPNEIDSVWHDKGNERVYYGHIFLIGIQKLRMLAHLAGFTIHKIYPTKINKSSLALLPLSYPFIYLANVYGFKRAMKKRQDVSEDLKQKTYYQQFKLNTSPQILIDKTLFVEFEKVI